jgi:hypothetical protein
MIFSKTRNINYDLRLFYPLHRNFFLYFELNHAYGNSYNQGY